MEKRFYSANGTLFTLFSEKTGMVYNRIYDNLSNPTERMTERGISWLGSIRTYRKAGKVQKIEFSLVIGLAWVAILFAFLWKALKWLVVALCTAIVWLFTNLGKLLKWIGIKLLTLLFFIGGLLAALWAWLMSKFKRRPKTEEPKEPKEKKPMNWKWLRWALPLVALFLIIWFWPNPKDIKPELISSNKVVNVMPRQTAIGRAYLDKEDNLLGCKFIFGEKAQKYLEGKENNLSTFESVSDASWVAEVDKLLNPEVRAELTDDQIALVTLVAMRNGRYGFEKSDFLKLVNKGEFEKAIDAIWIHDAKGNRRKLQDEGLRYTWCLWMIGKGYVTFDDLWNAPTWAYQNLDVKDLYDAKGNRVFNEELMYTMLGNGCSNPFVKDFKFFEGRNVVEESGEDIYVIPEDTFWNKVCRFVHPAKKALRGIFGVDA